MMTNQEVLSTYEAMQDLMQQMLEAAAASEWERLEALEQRVGAHTRALRANDERVLLDGAERQRKVALIRQMLDADRKIRDLTTPWMAQLSKLINSTGAERRLANAYGSV